MPFLLTGNTHQFEVIRRSVKKTDKYDSRILVYYLSKDMLPESRIQSKEKAQLQSLAGTRDKLVKQRTALVNKIYNVLNRHSLTCKKETLTTEKGLKGIIALDWEPIVQVELGINLEKSASKMRQSPVVNYLLFTCSATC